MKATIEAYKTGELRGIAPVAVIASKPDAPGLVKAQQYGIPTFVVNPKEFPTQEAFGDALLSTLRHSGAFMFFQMGWLPKTPERVVAEFAGRSANQHPGPLPDFGGKGMYGARVTAARLAYTWVTGSDHWTEATTHKLTKEYDEGSIIRVARMDLPQLPQPVTFAYLKENIRMFTDTVGKVQAQLLPLEHKNVIATLQMFADHGWINGFHRDQPLVPPEQEHVLYQAKDFAAQVFPKG